MTTQTSDLMALLHPRLKPGPFDLRTLLEHDPPHDWRPSEPGETVIGYVHRILTAHRNDYSFPVLELITEGQSVVRVNCSSTVLRNAIEGIRVGNVVSIELKKPKISQAGREYKVHEVRVLV